MKIREIIKSSLFWLPVIVFLFFSANVSTLLADAPWPMWRGNLRHTGLSPYDTSNIDGTEEWNFEAGGAIESSVAIGADGTIYFGCHDNKLYALNPDGTEKWRFDAGDPVYNEQWDVWKGILSSPAISSDGTIYFTSLSNYLFAVNSDGVEEWRYPISYNVDIWSSPAIGTDGTIYVGSHDLKMYAINPDGTKKWHFTVQSDTCCSPAVGEDGTIYIGSYDNDGGGPAAAGKLFAINPDGTEKWHFDTELWVESSPAIGSDGTIYFGSAEGNLYAVNSEGVEQWRFQSGPEEMFSSPAIDSDGIIYVASSNKNLHAINPDGTESWRFETENIIESSPVIGADGTIYLSSNGASIYAIDSDGTEKWNFTTEAAVVAAPAIGSNGVIYVGSWDSKLYAIGGTAVATTTTWYLAEGSTSGLDSWVLVQNPNAGSAEITLTYMDQDGNTAVQTETIAGQSRFTQKINNVTNMNNKSGVSTKVECTNDIAIIVERAMYWYDPAGSYWVGGHDSIGITTPGTTWYLAEGSTSGFDTYVLVQNPNASTANITITYMDQDGNTAVQTEAITGQSRFTQKINAVPNMNNKSGVSTTVASTNDIGIIVERAMYWNDPAGTYWIGGHDSIGAAATASIWYLAEGSTSGLDTYVLVQNPNTSSADITITYMDQDGNTAVQTETISGQSRFTQNINAVANMNNKSGVSTKVESANDAGIIVERAMYWNDPSGSYWVGGHDSIGTTTPGTTWYLAEGSTSGFDTYVLVQNPNTSTANITITYMDQDGNTAVQTETITGQSRFTQKINDVPNMNNKSGVSTTVASTNDIGIIVERAMYWNDPSGSYWVGGHDSKGHRQ